MIRICIDTNFYAAFKRGISEAVDLIEYAEEIIVPSIVLGELYAGFFIGNRVKENISELHKFLDLPGVFVADIDISIAERYGIIVKILRANGTPIPTNDIWIAAITLEKGTRLATFDTHFRLVPGIFHIDI